MGAQDTDLVLRVKALKRGYHRKVTLDRFSDLLGALSGGFAGWDSGSLPSLKLGLLSGANWIEVAICRKSAGETVD